MNKKSNVIKISLSAIMLSFLMTVVSFASWVNDGYDNWQYYERDGIMAMDTIITSGNDKFYVNFDGFMVRDYLLENGDNGIYYFDEEGKMVKDTWVAIEPTQVENQMENPPTIYLYYFGSNGKAYKASNGVKRKIIDGKKYLFNENGQMLSGWVDEQGNRYDEINSDEDPFDGFCYFAGDETDGVLREGWTAYEDGSVNDSYYLKQTLWFYFQPGSNKKYFSLNSNDTLKKKINGRTYAFDSKGVMIEGWDADILDPNNYDTSINAKNYFSEDEDDIGRMYKREWIFAVPSIKQNEDDHNQETKRWFYALGSGEYVKNEMRKINNNYYVFNDKGIMKKGLCVLKKDGKTYVDCIDIEKTDGKDFIISRYYVSMDRATSDNEFRVFDDEKEVLFFFNDDEIDDYFGRRILENTDVSFGDDDYVFCSKNNGELEGRRKEYYYQAGIKLKADEYAKLGLVFLGYASSSDATSPTVKPTYIDSKNAYANFDMNHKSFTTNDYNLSDYIVLKSFKDWESYNAYPVFAVVSDSGLRVKKSFTAQKDKNGFYWMIGGNRTFIQAVNVQLRYTKSSDGGKWQFKSEKMDKNGKNKTQWIDCYTGNNNLSDCLDAYDRTVSTFKSDKNYGYEVELDEMYYLNFRFKDIHY